MMQLIPNNLTNGHPVPEATPANRADRTFARAFTLMELMVSVSILVVILLSVGVIFGGASKSVSNSQAIMEMLANQRAIQDVIAHDVSHMDKNSFLVIRSRLYNTDTTVSPTGYRYIDVSPHYDQVSFVSLGSFPNRTGADNAASPFQDGQAVANAAHVWIGQLVVEKNPQPDASFMAVDQSIAPPLYQQPTGIIANAPNVPNENEFVLGIHHTLMFPGPPVGTSIAPAGVAIPAYASILYTAPSITGAGENSAHIASSRFGVASQSPSQFMANLFAFPPVNLTDWQNVCYRFKTLASVYEAGNDPNVSSNAAVSPFVNGYFRSTPIAMQGVSSFKIEWTDGTYTGTSQNWFSAANTYPQGAAADASINAADLGMGANSLNQDNYIAVFNPANRTKWPKSLRFSYHIADPNSRLSGGRDFVQVVRLPD